MIFRITLGLLSLLLAACNSLANTEAFNASFEFARTRPAVQESLGSNIRLKGSVFGEVLENPGDGEASLSFHLAGDRGEGLVDVLARKDASGWHALSGQWTFHDLRTPLSTAVEAPASSRETRQRRMGREVEEALQKQEQRTRELTKQLQDEMR